MPDFVPKKLKPYRVPIAFQEEVKRKRPLFEIGQTRSHKCTRTWQKGIGKIPMKDERPSFLDSICDLFIRGIINGRICPFGMKKKKKNVGRTLQKSMDNALLCIGNTAAHTSNR
ncbi:hypothetical protein TNIN_206871 [Trichonephila inaurata madagascariensis]|uniref:Uncharacterized protein n=1 Tax=Trichonephila inaurata madagascariensis TaxID=2747483 RepID=A0A8X6JVH1_9ARAC|nr:hypothetical protein TNIN_206871 [Trichonephila inaurata madagascariensis]